AKDQGTAVEVLGPDGNRVLSLKEAAAAQSFPATSAGFYELRRGNGRNELIAVNPDRRESSLDVIPRETLELWKKSGQGSAAEQTSGTAQNQGRKPWPVWWYLLLGAAVAAVAESLVAARHMNT